MTRAVQVVCASDLTAQQASTDDEMVALWLDSFRSPHTRRGYAADARSFRAFVAKPLRAVTVRDVQAFGAAQAGSAAASIGRRLSSVKSLLGLAHRLGYVPFDVGAPVRIPAVKDTLAERILPEWDVQRLLQMERNPRNAALLRLVYTAGLRISEACGLRWRDLSARDNAGQVTVFGKGGKTRAVLLPAPMWTRLLTRRGRAGPDGAVVRSRKGGGVTPRQVHRIVKAAAKRAKLSPAVSCHWLRHAHVSHSLDRGAPVHVVRETVGHSSLETTSRYAHIRPGDSSARYLLP